MIKEMLDAQRAYFASGKTWDVSERIANIKAIRELILKYRGKFDEAFKADYNKGEFDVLSTEVFLVLEECDYHIKHLKKEAKPRRVRTSLMNFPSHGELLQEPYGNCLIIAPWNYPFQLALEPLIGCLAAGNTAIIKPASAAGNVSRVMADMFKEFDKPGLVSVILGNHQQNADLLDQKYDYIFFTGGAMTGREILAKAAPNLTPVSLELGGKSPCLIDEDADVELAAKRSVWGKFLNAGQTCVAPDYFYVHEKVHEAFVGAVKKYIKAFYYRDGKLSGTFPHLISDRHVAKVMAFIDPAKVIVGGKLEGRLLEPTVMDGVSWDDKVMSDEIFGPIMPIIRFNDIDEALSVINSKPKPLAFYYFSKDKRKAKRVFARSPFGGGCYNDTIMHLTNESLPFGGVGRSGMGSYHGKWSFETFSHEKSLLVKGRMEVNVKYPPYTDRKMRLLKRIAKIKD
ncbi:MAG: aldehyde dehydrogenase family protein [Bacilli bacterium]|jgi:aldehyde dehydrogenase (NAD+)|nr:aldehyde dehydrogenase family protein [Bacilli bacterium]